MPEDQRFKTRKEAVEFLEGIEDLDLHADTWSGGYGYKAIDRPVGYNESIIEGFVVYGYMPIEDFDKIRAYIEDGGYAFDLDVFKGTPALRVY